MSKGQPIFGHKLKSPAEIPISGGKNIIFDQNFHFSPKYSYLVKISICGRNYHLRPQVLLFILSLRLVGQWNMIGLLAQCAAVVLTLGSRIQARHGGLPAKGKEVFLHALGHLDSSGWSDTGS